MNTKTNDTNNMIPLHMIKTMQTFRVVGTLLLLLLSAYMRKSIGMETHISLVTSVEIDMSEHEEVLKRHKKQHIITRYAGYIRILKQKYLTALAHLDQYKLTAILDELMLYGIDTITFEEISQQHLLVVGYFRSLNPVCYHQDIGHLLFHFAHLDIIQEDEEVIALKRRMWKAGSLPANIAHHILAEAVAQDDWAFISEWLVECMARAARDKSTGIDLGQYSDIFTQERIYYCLLPQGDNFLNGALLQWLDDQLGIQAIIETFGKDFPGSTIPLGYIRKSFENQHIIAEKTTYSYNNSTDTDAFLALLLHQDIVWAEYKSLDYIKQDIAVNPKYSSRSIIARYHLKYIISRDDCKQILDDLLDNRGKLTELCVYRYAEDAFKNETFFFPIILGLSLEKKQKIHVVLAILLHHHNRQEEVILSLSTAHQEIIYDVIYEYHKYFAPQRYLLLVEGYARKVVECDMPRNIALMLYCYLDKKSIWNAVVQKRLMGKYKKKLHNHICFFTIGISLMIFAPFLINTKQPTTEYLGYINMGMGAIISLWWGGRILVDCYQHRGR